MDGEDVAGRRRELHGQVGGGDNSAKGVEGWTTQEDIVGCWRVDDKEADWNGFGLGSLTKHGVKVDVAAGGYLFDFNGDDHMVILLMVEAMKVVVCEDDGSHAASVVGMCDMIDGLDMAEVFLFGRRGGSSTSEATRNGVDSAT